MNTKDKQKYYKELKSHRWMLKKIIGYRERNYQIKVWLVALVGVIFADSFLVSPLFSVIYEGVIETDSMKTVSVTVILKYPVLLPYAVILM